jgi:hypothetical protein
MNALCIETSGGQRACKLGLQLSVGDNVHDADDPFFQAFILTVLPETGLMVVSVSSPRVSLAHFQAGLVSVAPLTAGERM